MKTSFPYTATITAAIALTCLSTPLAHAVGGMDTGGVDAVQARRIQIQTLINGTPGSTQGGMQGDIQAYLDSINPALLTIEGANHIRELIGQGLAADVRSTTYVLREVCRSSAGRVVSASTQVGVMGAEICINIARIASQPVVPAEIYSLVLHEHAHHLGADTTAEGEHHASELGNAMGPQVAAFRFFNPRQEFMNGGNPVVERPTGQCLNLAALADKWTTEGGFITSFMQDFESLTSDLPYWAPAAFSAVRHGSFVGPVQELTRDKIYQIGCERILLENRRTGSFEVQAILNSSPTHIEVEMPINRQIINGEPVPGTMKRKYTAPSSESSHTFSMETTKLTQYALECQPLSRTPGQMVTHGSFTALTVAREVIIHTQTQTLENQVLPVTLRKLRLAEESANISRELSVGMVITGQEEGVNRYNRDYSSCYIQPISQIVP